MLETAKFGSTYPLEKNMQFSRSFTSFILCSLMLLGADSALSQKLQDNSSGHPFASKLLRHQSVNQSSDQLQNFEKELRTIPLKVAQFKAQTVALGKNRSSNISMQSAQGVVSPNGAPMRVVFDGNHPTPIFIEGPRLENSSTMSLKKLSKEAAAQGGLDFLIANAGLLRIENPAQEFELIDTDREDAGLTHLRYQQKYQGLEVWSQDIRIHLNADGSFESFNGRYISTPKSVTNYKAAVDEQSAVQIAQQQLGTGASEITSRRIIYVDEDGKARVVWLVQLRRGLGENWYHFIDIETGVTLKRYNNVMTDGPSTGSGVDLLNQTRALKLYQLGSTFYMIDPSKPMFNAAQSTIPQNGKGVIYTLDTKNTDSVYNFVTSTNPNLWSDKASVSASANGALVYDYYYQVHGRNAIDNNGSTIYMVVHWKKNFNNAFWNGRMMVFGEGDGSTYSNLAAGLDVTAHEMTHGVVERTANLVYENQSGALNESFADVFGEMSEYWAKGSCDWLIGEDVTTPGILGDALRDMADPASSKVAFNGQQPTNLSQYRSLPNTPSGDNGGVHINSGIPNRAFFLFATSPVVGNNNAAKVYYRTLTKYLTRSAQFTDCRIAVIKSAEDLFGGPGNAVAIIAGQAFDAVGISGGNPTQPPTSLPSVQGQPYLAMVGSQTGLLYRSSPDGQNILQISTGSLLGRPTPTDNGSSLFYVDKTNNLHIVSSDGSNHRQLSTTGGYNAVAISPNGRYLAATTSYQVPRLYVLDLLDTTNAGWKTYQLYIPIFAQGGTGGNVRFPDRIDWALNNELVMYDAYSTFINANGDTTGFWDVNLLRIADSSISRLIPPAPRGVNIGNPIFASNTDNLVAFDYIDEFGQVTVRATNVFKGLTGIVTNNFTSLGNPSFSTDDKKIFYHYVTSSSAGIWVVDLQQDGLTGAGNDKKILTQAEYPVTFTVGTRVTNVAPSAPKLASPSNGATGLPTNPILTWNSSSSANYYTLQVSTSQSFSSLVTSQTGLVDTSFKVSGLSNDVVYYWRVSAANTVGSSPYSDVASFTTIVAAPSAPVLVSPLNGTTGVATTTTLNWSASTGATKYRLQLSTSSSFATTAVDDSTVTGTSRQIGSLLNNTIYYWRVSVINAGGTSGWSTVWSFTTFVQASVVTLSLPTQTASVGGTITVPIQVTGFNHVGSFSLTITFDKNVLTYSGTANQPTFGIFNSTAAALANTNGTVSISWFNVSPALNIGSGTLMNLHFTYKSGSSALTFLNMTASSITDSLGTNLTATYTNGSISQAMGVNVSGAVIYSDGSVPVNGVIVAITRTDVTPNIITTLTTNTNGAFTTDPNKLTSGVYTFAFSKTGGHPSLYVNAADALKAALYSVDPATYPLTIIPKLAADVNNDGNVNSADALQIMLHYVGSVTSFAKGDWVFVPTATSKTLTTDDFVNNAVAIAVGDVNGDAVPSSGSFFAKLDGATQSVVSTSGAALRVNSSGAFEVPVRVKAAGSFGSVSLAFQYPVDGAIFVGVRGPGGMVSTANNGVVKVAWFNAEHALNLKDNSALITLRFKPTANVKDFSLTLDPNSQITDAEGTVITSINLEIPAIDASFPTVFALGQNYPNPFNPSTTISYQLPKGSNVSLNIFSTLGQLLATLVDDKKEPGYYSVVWNANVPTGIYFYRLQAGEFVDTKKMILLK